MDHPGRGHAGAGAGGAARGGLAAAEPGGGAKNGVAALKVKESQLPVIGKVMHDKYNRCAGFIAHDSEQEATPALETGGPPPPAPAAVCTASTTGRR